MAQAFGEPQNARVLPQSANGVSSIFAALEASISTSLRNSSTAVGKPSTAAQARAPAPPTVATLNALGIKVRDFAYESTLPRLKPVYRRQIQPSIRPLMRQVTEPVEEDDLFSEPIKKLPPQRTITEPAIEPTTAPTRMRGFANLHDYNFDGDFNATSSQQSHNHTPNPQFPPGYHTDTPLVTPNGTLQWRENGADRRNHAQLDVERKTAPLTVVSDSRSELTVSAEASTSQTLLSPSDMNVPGPSRIPVENQATPTKQKRRMVRSPSLPSLGRLRPVKSPRHTFESTAITPRYPLRNRGGSAISSITSVRRQSLRSHATDAATPVTIQSNCGRGKDKNGPGPPNARPLRKHPVWKQG